MIVHGFFSPYFFQDVVRGGGETGYFYKLLCFELLHLFLVLNFFFLWKKEGVTYDVVSRCCLFIFIMLLSARYSFSFKALRVGSMASWSLWCVDSVNGITLFPSDWDSHPPFRKFLLPEKVLPDEESFPKQCQKGLGWNKKRRTPKNYSPPPLTTLSTCWSN